MWRSTARSSPYVPIVRQNNLGSSYLAFGPWQQQGCSVLMSPVIVAPVRRYLAVPHVLKVSAPFPLAPSAFPPQVGSMPCAVWRRVRAVAFYEGSPTAGCPPEPKIPNVATGREAKRNTTIINSRTLGKTALVVKKAEPPKLAGPSFFFSTSA